MANTSTTTSTVRDPRLAELVQRLIALYRPDEVYLFGSVARGEADVDSDYDLMVVVPDATPVEARRPGRAYDALWGLGIAADVLVCTRSAFDDRRHLKASLPATILREGQLLHAA